MPATMQRNAINTKNNFGLFHIFLLPIGMERSTLCPNSILANPAPATAYPNICGNTDTTTSIIPANPMQTSALTNKYPSENAYHPNTPTNIKTPNRVYTANANNTNICILCFNKYQKYALESKSI